MTAPLAPIAHDVSLRCRCGRVELRVHDVSPKVASRVICHCDGCTRFAERMDRSVLDEHGGTERFNVSPACLEFASGIDALGCIQQSSKGALRWVATCCDTPLGLTLPSARMPFVGLDVARLDQRALPVELTELIGPLRARVNGHFDREVRGAMKADVASLLGMLAHLAPLTFTWWLRGDQQRSPFFSMPTGEPVVEVDRQYPAEALRLAGCR